MQAFLLNPQEYVEAWSVLLAANAETGFGDLDEIKMSMVALVDDLLREFDGVKTG